VNANQWSIVSISAGRGGRSKQGSKRFERAPAVVSKSMALRAWGQPFFPCPPNHTNPIVTKHKRGGLNLPRFFRSKTSYYEEFSSQASAALAPYGLAVGPVAIGFFFSAEGLVRKLFDNLPITPAQPGDVGGTEGPPGEVSRFGFRRPQAPAQNFGATGYNGQLFPGGRQLLQSLPPDSEPVAKHAVRGRVALAVSGAISARENAADQPGGLPLGEFILRGA